MLGERSFRHWSKCASFLRSPRGQRRSTRIRTPSPRAGGSYACLIEMLVDGSVMPLLREGGPLRRGLPFEAEQASGQRCGDASCVNLGVLGHRSTPTLIERLDEQEVPAVEEFGPESLEFVHLLMCSEYESVVSRMSEKDATPEVDELRYVHRPIHLGNLDEHRREKLVEGNFPIEPDDQVVNLLACIEITRVSWRQNSSSHY